MSSGGDGDIAKMPLKRLGRGPPEFPVPTGKVVGLKKDDVPKLKLKWRSAS
jgi:hypothetical protein